MRFLPIFLSLSIATLTFGCKDDIWNDSLAPQSHFGEATLARNLEIFDCIPFVKTSTWNDTTINLSLLHFKANTIPRGQLLISNFPPRVGTYSIKLGTSRTSDGPGSLYGTYLYDGDFGGDIFTYD